MLDGADPTHGGRWASKCRDSPVKVVAWNLGHQVRQKQNLGNLGELFAALDADVLLLNEFVDGPSRGPFRDSLRSAGYPHQLVSFTPGVHNQIFAAARQSFSLGDIAPPSFDGSAISNFLHIRFDHTAIELVGLRVPAYETSAERHAYRPQLLEIMERASVRPIAFAGDINENPFRKIPNAPEVRFAGCDSYRVTNPAGDWSYMSANGKTNSRIDHVLFTDMLTVTDPVYVQEFDGRLLAAAHSLLPISDHAALTFTVEVSPPLTGSRLLGQAIHVGGK